MGTLVLISVGNGNVRPRFLDPGPAAKPHRAAGDAIVVLLVTVGVMGLSHFGLEEGAFHAVTGALLLAVLTLKVVVLRWRQSAGRFMPVLGISVFPLPAATDRGGPRRRPYLLKIS